MDNIDLNKYFKGLKNTKGENIIENTPEDTETLKVDNNEVKENQEEVLFM